MIPIQLPQTVWIIHNGISSKPIEVTVISAALNVGYNNLRFSRVIDTCFATEADAIAGQNVEIINDLRSQITHKQAELADIQERLNAVQGKTST